MATTQFTFHETEELDERLDINLCTDRHKLYKFLNDIDVFMIGLVNSPERIILKSEVVHKLQDALEDVRHLIEIEESFFDVWWEKNGEKKRETD